MKKLFYILAGITLITVGGCSTSSPTSPASSEKGSVAFKLDKATIPQGVVTVEAILSRSGYDSLTASVDVQTDTSATLQMSGIPIGQWHLTVNALDGGGNILYSGEADVSITTGANTQLSLTLQPTSPGTGSISITVNWGTSGVHFVDYASNPVFTRDENPSYPAGVAFPKIIIDNGIYKMWYVATSSSSNPGIWYAQSNDGINWTTEGSQPVLTTTDSSFWDYNGLLGGGGVLKDGGTYRMYYNVRVSGDVVEVGLATSSDGRVWTKYPSPVLMPDSSSQYHIGVESVLKVNGTYYLYYDAYPEGQALDWTINVATSSDGVTWTKYSGNPILTATATWQGSGVLNPTVIFDNGEFVMTYNNADRSGFGLAYSSDGFHWVNGSSQPAFSEANTVLNYISINYPLLIKTPSDYRIYYTGVDNGNQLTISFASSQSIE